MAQPLTLDRNTDLAKKYDEILSDSVSRGESNLEAATIAMDEAKASGPHDAIELLTVAALLAANQLEFEMTERIPQSDVSSAKGREMLRLDMKYAEKCYLTSRKALELASTLACRSMKDMFPDDVAKAYRGLALASQWISEGYEEYQKAQRRHSAMRIPQR